MILVIDNYDSFTYNLVQYLAQCGAEVVVRRNDEITMSELQNMQPSGIMLSPGPCTPNDSVVCLEVVTASLHGQITVPVFGVCLGHQAIGLQSGGVVRRADQIRHGKASMIEHDGTGVFSGLPSPFSAIRYHSLVIAPETLHPEFVVTARSLDDHEIMGIRHRTLPLEGVQFHPESVLTEHGLELVRNFVNQTLPPQP